MARERKVGVVEDKFVLPIEIDHGVVAEVDGPLDDYDLALQHK